MVWDGFGEVLSDAISNFVKKLLLFEVGPGSALREHEVGTVPGDVWGQLVETRGVLT